MVETTNTFEIPKLLSEFDRLKLRLSSLEYEVVTDIMKEKGETWEAIVAIDKDSLTDYELGALRGIIKDKGYKVNIAWFDCCRSHVMVIYQ